MLHYNNFSLENLTEEVDGLLYTEEWRNVEGYENCYQISSFGRVKALYRIVGKCPNGGINARREKIRKQSPDKDGYLRITFTANYGKKYDPVHRAVAKAFIPNPESKSQVNHLKGIKNDNRVWELAWATQKEDFDHAIKLGLKKKIGEKHPDAKLTNAQVLEIFKSDLSYSELAQKYNVITGKVSIIKTGKKWASVTGKKYRRSNGIDKHIVISIFNSNLLQKDISIIYGVGISMISRIKHGVRYGSITNQLKTA